MYCKLFILSRFSRVALLSIVLLSVLDVLTTWIDFQRGAHEGNPLAAPLVAWFGFGGILLYKILFVLVVTGCTLTLEQLKAIRIAHLLLALGLFLSFLPVLNNAIVAFLHPI